MEAAEPESRERRDRRAALDVGPAEAFGPRPSRRSTATATEEARQVLVDGKRAREAPRLLRQGRRSASACTAAVVDGTAAAIFVHGLPGREPDDRAAHAPHITTAQEDGERRLETPAGRSHERTLYLKAHNLWHVFRGRAHPGVLHPHRHHGGDGRDHRQPRSRPHKEEELKRAASARGWQFESKLERGYRVHRWTGSTDGISWVAESLTGTAGGKKQRAAPRTSRAGTAPGAPASTARSSRWECRKAKRNSARRSRPATASSRSSRRRPSVSRSTRRSTSTSARAPARKSTRARCIASKRRPPASSSWPPTRTRARASCRRASRQALVDAVERQGVGAVQRGSPVDPAAAEQRFRSRAWNASATSTSSKDSCAPASRSRARSSSDDPLVGQSG